MTTDPFTEAARAEAEGKYLYGRHHETTYTDYAARREQLAFAAGAEWARTHLAAQEETSTLPERFRNPEDLARFVVENEWALESEINPSGRADWKETLVRVYDAWDGDTPEDIVSTIAAAVRLDRSFRAALSAALTEPPRPEGAEDIEAILSELPDTMLPATDAGRADLLASRGVRVPTNPEEDR